ncbi:uncharacterized protein JN550_008906 [Neoarthrinium moseri]|uniref:uncharacterized protein n=1 Tax=Neoarthrinium moseri TaxID=1658444 RepID=UPI001FDB335F|nr:uncharacterized protein JN550_008906 [Neoarthrinium moseri]KAI1864349.1 hypothetical protein JN550_008906 [Neoarthrinium moseri]
MDPVYQIPFDTDLHALLSSCSDIAPTPSWPSPLAYSMRAFSADEMILCDADLAGPDMLLDGIDSDLSSNGEQWAPPPPQQIPTSEKPKRGGRSKRGVNPDMAVLQSKFSAGRKSYLASQSPEAWELHRAELKRLYIDEGRTLKDIMSIMESKGFKARVALLYKTRFKQWDFVKNNSREDVARMLHVKRQRAAVGKPTTFKRNGKVVRIDEYLKKNGMIIIPRAGSEPPRLPGSVRCITPPPISRCLRTPGALVLKELILQSLKNLTPSFSRLSRPMDGKHTPKTEIWDSPRYIKMACDLFSENRNVQAGSICRSAFTTVHALVSPPRLDTLFNFLVSQLWWSNRDITLELWRYLAAYMSNVLKVQNEVTELLRELVLHIETQGYESYLDFIAECIDDILVLGAERTPFLRGNKFVGWCQLVIMDCYFLNGSNRRASQIQARCADALPRSTLFPEDRAMNEKLWRETFARHVSLSYISGKESRHDRFLRLATASYAKLLGRLNGALVMHPSLTRVEGVAASLSRKKLDPSAITHYNRSYSLESRILSFLTRDISKPSQTINDYGSYPV